MKPVVLLFGPTASGKTALALSLARRFSVEIVSADSMQIYRGMDIGTAKATPAERAAIPHHCIDLCDICESFSTAQYRAAAIESIRGIHARGHLPIVIGGTGLYFDALLSVPTYGAATADPALRTQLQKEILENGSPALHRRLSLLDPASAERIHPNDAKRIVRALEIYASTGKKPSEVLSRKPNTEFDFLSFFLNFQQRTRLYEACDRRAEQMINSGLLNEVKSLISKGLLDAPTASQAIGYKELIPCVLGDASLSEALNLIQKRTRNYAKRQITWFSKLNAIPLPAGDPSAETLIFSHIETFLKERHAE